MAGISSEHKATLLATLSRHIGQERAISMAALQRAVFGDEVDDKINGTRMLRKLVTELRRAGTPIASCTSCNGGGYYLAAAGSEMTDYLERLRRRALSALVLEAAMRRQTLPELIRQIQLGLTDQA